MIRKIIIIGICIFLVVLFLSHFLVVFKRNVFLSDIKGLVEEKVGSLFDARVKIGAVKVGLFKYVSLSGLRVNQQLKKKFFYLVDIKTIVFKYNIFNFFKINFAAPNKVSLYTPTLEFNRFKIPDNLLNQAFSWGKSNVLLEIRDGAVCYVLPNIKTKFLFEHINGYVKPYDLHTLALKFKARGGGDIAGAIGLNGFFNEKTKICELDISLDNITIASPTFAPINNLRGKVRISNEIITIEEITFFIRDVPIRLTGTITQYSEKPILDLHFSIDTKHITSTVRIFGIYSDLKIEGEIRLARYHYTYRGAIDLKEGGFAVRELTINDDYVSEGDFSFNEGIYTIFFKKANQEVQCQFLHTDYVMKLNITLNHVSLLDYDFVTVGYIELEPDVSFWRDQALVFNGTIETEYMIFNYTPLNDFKGTFTLYADAVRNIHCSWGKAYALTGNINFNEPREMDGLFTITDLNLQDCESFGGYVIPKDIEATISGRIKVFGSLDDPRIEGYLSSGAGQFRGFDFKKTSINFSGNRYVLALKDSKIYRSSNIFYLNGKVDFTKKNVFHDVLLESSEKIILWRGWDLSKSEGADTVVLKKKVTDNVNLNVERDVQQSKEEDSSHEGEVSLEYNYREDQSISLSFEDEEDEEMISLKHRITF